MRKSVIVLLAWITTACSVCTDMCFTSGIGWNSNLIVTEFASTSVVVEWNQDVSSNYLVNWYDRQEDNSSNIIGSHATTALRFNITDLIANFNYEVEVCRAVAQNSDDDCGNCRLCVSTPPMPIPGMVMNVRVFAYRPLANEDVFSALVLWDAPANSVVSSYSVSLTQDGGQVPDVYQPRGNETYHTLFQRENAMFQVSYFSPGSTQYSVQIAADSPSGSGPLSVPITFDFMSPNYPRQVLALSPRGAQVIGTETNFVTPPSSVASSRLLAIDTITREVFYYCNSSAHPNSILRSSLQREDVDILLLIDASLELMAMAYDWVARELYYATKDGDSNLQLYRIPVFNKDGNTRLFPGLIHSVPDSDSLQLAVDPTLGFLYWLQFDGVLVQFHSLNLRQTNSNTTTLLSTSSSRKKRHEGNLASLNISPVLTLDSVTSDLLVASTSGDIHSCDVGTEQCEVVVNVTTLHSTPSTVGLPPTSIAVDERHIYWANKGVAGVYAVARTNTSTLIQLSTETASSLFGLSPGSQPLGSLNCLSPDFTIQQNRLWARVRQTTSTTVTLKWDEVMLSPECENITFSFPPIMYEIFLSTELSPFLMKFVAATFDTEFTVRELEPFSQYSFNVAAFNVFSRKRSRNDNLRGFDTFAKTTEGVPDQPTILNFIVLGTATVELTWLHDNVQGPLINVIYYIRTVSGQVTAVSATNAIIDITNGVIPGSLQKIEVFISNGAFNSTAASVVVPFWPLAPAPRAVDSTNSSFSVSVELRLPRDGNITGVSLQHCLASSAIIDNEQCCCPNSEKRTTVQEGMPPSDFNFTVSNLSSFTDYCLQSVARYTSVGGAAAEITAGLGVIRRTSAGLPEAPVVMLSGSILSWTTPLSRSEGGITHYIIIAQEVLLKSRIETDTALNGPIDLQIRETLQLQMNVPYEVWVKAENEIGAGPRSNSVFFQRVSTCGSPPSISNGSPGAPSMTTFGGRVTYNCDTGYEVSPGGGRTAMATCQADSSWGALPTCSAVDCGPLDSPINGAVSTPNGTTFRNTASYRCNPGYTIRGISTRVCQVDTMWSFLAPTCVVLCPRESLSSGIVAYSKSEDPPPVGTVATYSCDTGYELSGNEMRTCVGSGWSGPLPVCNIVDCGVLTSPTNGIVDTSSGTTFSQVATYSCDSGYMLSGDMPRTCQANGVWSSSAPSCEFILFSIGRPITFTTINSTVLISDIGEGDSALICYTELTTCCREQDNPMASDGALGEWIGPDGSSISSMTEFGNKMEGFYTTRSTGSISLNHRGSAGQGGLYCCVIPRVGGTQTLCLQVNDVIEASVSSSDPTLGFSVAIAAILIVSAAVIAIPILVLIVKTRQLQRESRAPHSLGTGASKPQAYETPDQAFYKDVSKMDVGGAGDHTHTPTIELKESPGYAPTEVIQDGEGVPNNIYN